MSGPYFTSKDFEDDEAAAARGEELPPPQILADLREAVDAGDGQKLRDVLVDAAPLLYALQVDSGYRCLTEIQRRDLSKEQLKNLAIGGGVSTDKLRDLARALAEAAPSTFHVMTDFATPEPGQKCPMCGAAWKKRDTTGFDKKPGDKS